MGIRGRHRAGVGPPRAVSFSCVTVHTKNLCVRRKPSLAKKRGAKNCLTLNRLTRPTLPTLLNSRLGSLDRERVLTFTFTFTLPLTVAYVLCVRAELGVRGRRKKYPYSGTMARNRARNRTRKRERERERSRTRLSRTLVRHMVFIRPVYARRRARVHCSRSLSPRSHARATSVRE